MLCLAGGRLTAPPGGHSQWLLRSRRASCTSLLQVTLWGARMTHIISRIFLCVLVICRFSLSVLLFRGALLFACSRNFHLVSHSLQFSPGLPQLTIFIWSFKAKGFMFIVGSCSFSVSRGHVACRRHHCIRVPFDPRAPLPVIETQKSPCQRCGRTRFTW